MFVFASAASGSGLSRKQSSAIFEALQGGLGSGLTGQEFFKCLRGGNLLRKRQGGGTLDVGVNSVNVGLLGHMLAEPRAGRLRST